MNQRKPVRAETFGQVSAGSGNPRTARQESLATLRSTVLGLGGLILCGGAAA